MADFIIDMPDDPNNQVIKIDNNVTAPNEQVINIDNHVIDPIDQVINIDNQETAPNEQVTGLNINNNEPDKTIDEHDRTMDQNANEIEGNEEIIDEDNNRPIEHEGTIDELDAEQGGEVPACKSKLRCNHKKLRVGLLVALEFLLLSAVPAMVLYFIMANTQDQMRAELQLKVEELSTAWNNTKLMEEEIGQQCNSDRWHLLFRNERQTSVELAEQNKRMRSILSTDIQSFIWGFCDSTTLQCSRCIPGWTEYNGRCFHLSQEKENWNNARRKCLGFGGDLAVVRDAEDQALLTDMTFQYQEQHPKGNLHLAWIGLEDKVTEGSFFWVNGRPVMYPVNYWKVRQPNNVVARWDKDKTGQDCVAIFPPKSAGGKDWLNNWNDIACVGTLHYICETKALILT